MRDNQSLACFFETCQREFAFLTSEHGFESLSGLTEYYRGRHIIIPDYDIQSVGYPFYACARYEHEAMFIELSYGDYNFTLDCHVTFQRRYRFHLADIIKFIHPSPVDAPISVKHYAQTSSARQAHHISSLLATHKQMLQAYINNLLTLPDDVVARALDEQHIKLQQQVREHHANNKRHACKKAEAAFQQCDYKRAIMLYRPYKDDLGPHDHRIFSLAILYLDQ